MSELKYSKSHEWIKKDSNVVTIGITDYAQSELGDIVFVELPTIDDQITKESSFGVVESVKAVSDLIAPISGKIIAINDNLNQNPELINNSPNDNGWIAKIEYSNETELDELMNEEEYKVFVEQEKS